MIATLHDLARGVVKQVVNVKFQYIHRRQIVVEELGTGIDRRAEINAVVAEVDEDDPLFKRQGGTVLILADAGTVLV